jgi:Domain of unknown function (DUF4136)
MRRKVISIMPVILLLTGIVARADKVTSDHDKAVNFFKYKSFMWIKEPEPKEPFMKERIIAAVNAQLIAKGFHLVNSEADLAIGANFATEEKHTWETYYNDIAGWGWGLGWGGGWGGSGWASTTEDTYEVGTLTVDLFDVQSRKLVWQGVATGTLQFKAEKRTKNCYKEIEKMFKNFPPGIRE